MRESQTLLKEVIVARLRFHVTAVAAVVLSFSAIGAGQTKGSVRGPSKVGAARARIHVESSLVIIRAFVMSKKLMARPITAREEQCIHDEVAAFESLGPRDPWRGKLCLESSISGLTVGDFQIYVEGEEQRIVAVATEDGGMPVRDNFGRHNAYSVAPTGIWSTTDLYRPGVYRGLNMYNISFAPSESAATGCHEIRIKVDRRHSVVYAERAYCASQSPSDTLNGSSFGGQMEHDLVAGGPGGIPLALQAGFVYGGTGSARVHVSLEFPWDSLDRQWRRDWSLEASIGVLGMVYKEGGALAHRFSELACCSGDTSFVPAVGMGGFGLDAPLPLRNELESAILDYFKRHENRRIPTRYETQFGLHSGKYDLKVVLSDGEKFGRAEVPLDIPAYDGKTLALSSVMLCKRYRDAYVAAVERAAANFAPQYVPLVSKGIEFTPAGDTRFKKGEPLIPYFEVYEPLLAVGTDTKVQAHIRILDAKTGAVVKDFPFVDAAPYEKPASTTIPIAREISTSAVPRGKYRLEVQATDSAGRTTALRTAEFTID
jgi:hypothetical protein